MNAEEFTSRLQWMLESESCNENQIFSRSNFLESAAMIWSEILDVDKVITSHQVALCMMWIWSMRLSEEEANSQDGWLDLMRFAAYGAEAASAELPKQEFDPRDIDTTELTTEELKSFRERWGIEVE
jgi:hypothetical protein